MSVRNLTAYIDAVISECEEIFDATGPTRNEMFEARKALWHAAVVIYEVAGDEADEYLDVLRNSAVTVIRPTAAIESTIRSAGRRVHGHGN